jgi:Uncharacterized conserved protein (DUF2075)
VQKQSVGASEPEHLLEFSLRVPRWSVFIALIGTGQAIHVGEEGGLPLWRSALEGVARLGDWAVHCAPAHAEGFRSTAYRLEVSPTLSLDTTLRFHLTADVYRYIEGILDDAEPGYLVGLAACLRDGGHRFLITRCLDDATNYLRDRYSESPLARFGLLASSKDKLLPRFGVDNTYQTTKRLREGRWYNSPPSDAHSCCQLTEVATEFASQGLELDFALLAWGSDLRRVNRRWSDDQSSGYRRPVRDRLALRKNVYRVLLTRGRDGTVVYVPQIPELEETWLFLCASGFTTLGDGASG